MDVEHAQADSPADIDLTLLRLVADGDQQAMRMFYRRQARFIYSLAINVVHDESDAEEVTQETFWRVWRHAGKYDASRATLRGWLAMLTRRIAIDRTRSKTYRAREAEVPAAVVAANGLKEIHGGNETVTADEQHLKNYQSRRVQRALGELDEGHRKLIRLSYFDGLSQSNIADQIGAPLGTVKTRLREAIRQLRIKLQVEA